MENARRHHRRGVISARIERGASSEGARGPASPSERAGRHTVIYVSQEQTETLLGASTFRHGGRFAISWLKPNGSQDLELIVNGIEAPTWSSGEANGYFINKLLNGRMPSYQTLLKAKATDSLRVVDGEIDNVFDPKTTSVRLSAP